MEPGHPSAEPGPLSGPVERTLNPTLAVRQGKVLYLAAPLLAAYKRHDYWAYRAMVQGLLADLLPDRLLYPKAPGWVECTVQEQPATAEHAGRRIVHMVAYQPRRSLQRIPHVDQSWPIAGAGFRLRADGAPARVYLAPGGETLAYKVEDGYVEVELPRLHTNAVIVIEYES